MVTALTPMKAMERIGAVLPGALKSTISMAIFNSKLLVYQRVVRWFTELKDGDCPLRKVLEITRG